jgi:hypothetical protein
VLLEHQEKIDAVATHKENISKYAQLFLTPPAVASAAASSSQKQHHITGSTVLNQRCLKQDTKTGQLTV